MSNHTDFDAISDMIAVTHTPGPWRIGSLESYEGETGIAFRRVYFPADHMEIQEAHVRGDNCDQNARLISASPEMLAALKEAERFMDYFANGRLIFEGGGTPRTCLKTIQDAIAKAEGA